MHALTHKALLIPFHMHWVMSQDPASRRGLCHKNLNNIQWVVSQKPTPHVLGNFIQSIPHAMDHVKKSCSTYSNCYKTHYPHFTCTGTLHKNPTPNALG